MRLAEEETFINKAAVQRELYSLPENTCIPLEVRKTKSLGLDVLEILNAFAVTAERRNIDNPKSYRQL